MPPALAALLMIEVAKGLHYAHTRVGIDGKALGIVHRDISPQNLIATFDGGLKVVDFGIAKLATHHTNSGKLKGKLAYMSPEQARGEQLDARSDVFSLGIVLFEVVTRTRLLPKMNDLDLLTLMAGNEPLPKVSERRADVPPGSRRSSPRRSPASASIGTRTRASCTKRSKGGCARPASTSRRGTSRTTCAPCSRGEFTIGVR